jgi:hypothetical protein
MSGELHELGQAALSILAAIRERIDQEGNPFIAKRPLK